MAAEPGMHGSAEPRGGSRAPIGLLLAVAFVLALGSSAWMPLLPLYLRGYVQPASVATIARHVGLLGGVYTLALFACAAWWGRLSDRVGRRPVLIAGFATYLVGMLGSAIATDLVQAYAARILSGIGAAAVLPAAQAYLADLGGGARRNRRFAMLGGASFAGFVIGPLLGSWLAGPVMGMRPLDMPWMIDLPLLAVAAIGSAILPFVTLWLVPTARAPAVIRQARTDERESAFMRTSMLLAALAAFAVGSFEVGFNLFGRTHLRAGPGAVAALFVTCSASMLLAQGLLAWEPLRRRFDRRWMVSAFAASAVSMALAPLMSGILALAMAVAVVATSIGLIAPALAYAMLDRDGTVRGAQLGSLAAAGNLGQAIGSLLAGWLFAIRPQAPFGVAALVLAAGAAAAHSHWNQRSIN